MSIDPTPRGDFPVEERPVWVGRLIAGVLALWLLGSVLFGAQATLGASLQDRPVPLLDAIRTALVDSAPWVPAILLVIGLTALLPITRTNWKRLVWIHLLAIPVVSLVANTLVVLRFAIASGDLPTVSALLSQSVFWATIQIHVAAVLYVAGLGATLAARYYRQSRDRELGVARLEAQLARARLDALTAQIRPHFLYNTLHTIGHLWRTGRGDEADRLLDHLGMLFRNVQSSTSRHEVALRDELDLVREYLAIEEVRFRDRLRVKIEATPEAQSCAVPPLILQPIVENAIRHGISVDSSAGQVEITASVVDGRLRITVTDDGPGIRDDAPRRGSGTGLTNTRERLTQRYGPEGRLELAGGREAGTTVTLRMPAQPAESRRAATEPAKELRRA